MRRIHLVLASRAPLSPRQSPAIRARPMIGFADLFSRYRLIGIDTQHFGIGMGPIYIIGIGIIYRHVSIYSADNPYLSVFLEKSVSVYIYCYRYRQGLELDNRLKSVSVRIG